MKPSWKVRKLLSLALCTLLAAAPAAARASAEDRRPAWIKTPDERLEKRFTIRAPRVQVGELLEELARKGGITLDAEAGSGGTSDFEIIVYVRDCPLWKVMEGIRALFSIRGAEWSWTQTGSPEGPRGYWLSRGLAAQKLGARLREQIQRDFEQGPGDEIRWLRASEDERRKLEAANPDLKKIMAGERLRGGVALIANHVSAQQRSALLRSESPVLLTMEQLRDSEKQWAQQIWDNAFPSEFRAQHPSPERIAIHVGWGQGEMCPVLYIQIDRGGAYAYAGAQPLHDRWSARVQEMWITEGERMEAPLARRVIEGKDKTPPIV